MWKYYDFRCLKPSKRTKSKDWPHFEMSGYRSAKNKEELKNVSEIKFDKYFFNLEDPKVFKEMMKGSKREIIWKNTYGFDFIKFWDDKDIHFMNDECYIDCLTAEYGRFAKQCRKKGGLFKCCMTE